MEPPQEPLGVPEPHIYPFSTNWNLDLAQGWYWCQLTVGLTCETAKKRFGFSQLEQVREPLHHNSCVSTAVAAGFVRLHWHPNTTPRYVVFFLKMAVCSMLFTFFGHGQPLRSSSQAKIWYHSGTTFPGQEPVLCLSKHKKLFLN